MGKGLLITISGFSGAGKGTLMKELLSRYPNEHALSVSATTRQPREGETDGVEYFFKTVEEFERMIEEDRLIEHARYVDNYYGTPKEFVFEQLEAGKDVLLEIEVQGALQVKEKFPQTVSIFVTPPSVDELIRRLRGRGTETEEKIQKRIRQAAVEAGYAFNYDYILVNDDLETAVCELKDIINAEHARATNQKELLIKLQSELGGER